MRPRFDSGRCVQRFMYFQLRGVPSAIHSIAVRTQRTAFYRGERRDRRELQLPGLTARAITYPDGKAVLTLQTARAIEAGVGGMPSAFSAFSAVKSSSLCSLRSLR